MVSDRVLGFLRFFRGIKHSTGAVGGERNDLDCGDIFSVAGTPKPGINTSFGVIDGAGEISVLSLACS